MAAADHEALAEPLTPDIVDMGNGLGRLTLLDDEAVAVHFHLGQGQDVGAVTLPAVGGFRELSTDRRGAQPTSARPVQAQQCQKIRFSIDLPLAGIFAVYASGVRQNSANRKL